MARQTDLFNGDPAEYLKRVKRHHKEFPLTKQGTFNMIVTEVVHARKQFPTNNNILSVIGSSYFEFIKAVERYEKNDPTMTATLVCMACIKLAAMTIRYMEEGDAKGRFGDYT